MPKTMKGYIAAPVVGITTQQKNDIAEIVRRVRKSLDLYSPAEMKIPNAWGMPMNEWARCVFTIDVMEMDKADWIIICDYGRQSTAGTSWEAGYAFAKEKDILVIQMPNVNEVSLMVRNGSKACLTYKDFLDKGFDFAKKPREKDEGVVQN